MQRFGVSGLSTTYLTGTLTTIVIRVTSGKKLAEVSHSLWILLGLVTGAAIGALLVRHLPVAVPLVQLGTVLAVLGTIWISQSPSIGGVLCRRRSRR